MKPGLLAELRNTALDIDRDSGASTDPSLTGFSGQKLLACLRRFTGLLCAKDKVYVEIGVFQGMTLVSNAAANPGVDCFGIDNFSLFNEGKTNLGIVESRIKERGLGNAHIINLDYEDALNTLADRIGDRKIGVFFVDGPHDYRSQLVPLLLAKRFMAESCAIVVDDANYAHVRQASADFLRSHDEFAMLFEAYTPAHLANMTEAQKKSAIAGWWDGVNVLVRDPERLIPRTFPREENKHLYFASHETFRHEFAELAYPALSAVQKMFDAPAAEAESALSGLKSEFAEHRKRHPQRFPHQNTYSGDLPAFRIHV